MSNEEDLRPLCIDTGSYRVRTGFAGEASPRSQFPAIIGDREPTHFIDKNGNVLEKGKSKRGVLTLKYPIEHGVVTNWKGVEKMWNHAFFNELRITPESLQNRCVMLTDAPKIPKKNREKMTEIMFETFNVAGLFVLSAPLAALYAAARTTGIVVDIGYNAAHTVPIFEGKVLPHAVLRLDVAGLELTTYMLTLLNKKGYSFHKERANDMEIVRDIKEKTGYVALDYEWELEKAASSSDLEKNYQIGSTHLKRKAAAAKAFKKKSSSSLTMGKIIAMKADPDKVIEVTVEKERFQCVEALFQPSLVGNSQDGIGELVFNSIMKCDVDIRQALYNNIVLCGGSSLFSGIAERFQKEVKNLAPESMTIKVIAPPNRDIIAWKGAAIMAGLSTFDAMWITRDEYAASGVNIVHRKCT